MPAPSTGSATARPGLRSATDTLMTPACRSELDHVGARRRHLLGDDHGTTLGQVVDRIKLHEGIVGSEPIDRHDHVVAALGRAGAGADALRRRAGDDDAFDAALL